MFTFETSMQVSQKVKRHHPLNVMQVSRMINFILWSQPFSKQPHVIMLRQVSCLRKREIALWHINCLAGKRKMCTPIEDYLRNEFTILLDMFGRGISRFFRAQRVKQAELATHFSIEIGAILRSINIWLHDFLAASLCSGVIIQAI